MARKTVGPIAVAVRAWNRLAAMMGPRVAKRFSLNDYAEVIKYQGHTYAMFGSSSYTKYEEIETNFEAYVAQAYKSNGVVFATSLARMLLFTQIRLMWQPLINGRPSRDLYHTPELGLFEKPWPNGRTDSLLARMEQDVTNGGNFFAARDRDRVRRLRPDWVQIILTAPPAEAIASDVAGYLYLPGGYGVSSVEDGQVYLPDEVVHWAPIPDPVAQFRGMSWLTPVVREIMGDRAATDHKLAFFENGAKPGLVATLKETVTPEQFREFIKEFNLGHQGTDNAYKTLFLGGGADVTVAGANMEQLDFKGTQGAGETRITAAGGVPAVIVGLSEGLQAATYSNYGQARRKFGDHWGHPQWGSAAGALSNIVTEPANSRLWYDGRDIPFLREDEKDAAEVMFRRAATMRAYTDSGWTPESAQAAILNEDESLLVHSGMFSVQLQPPGTVMESTKPAPTAKEE